MIKSAVVSKNLRGIVCSVVEGTPARHQLNELIILCHSLATVFVRSKISIANLSARFHFSSHSDLAYDCIAELFQQDESGVLVQLKAYFEGIGVRTVHQDMLFSYLRRLVFAKVNQSIYRLYNEADPTLGKILRNIRLSIQTLQNFLVKERFGELCIVPTMCETLDHLPTVDRTELEKNLVSMANGSERIPVLLGKLSYYLREQTAHSRVVPLVYAALAFRSIYSMREGEAVEVSEPDDHLTLEAAVPLIDEACEEVKKKAERKYVGIKKVDSAVFNNYFVVVKQLLCHNLQNGDTSSLFEGLQTVMPETTREEYQKKHRSKLEYLTRLARKQAMRKLRDAER